MLEINVSKKLDWGIVSSVILLLIIGFIVLNSLGFMNPLYVVFALIGLLIFFVFANLDFEILSIFSKHIYILSIIFLILPIIIGQATRGTIRWIPIFGLTLQPAELVRPFLLVFFSEYLITSKKSFMNLFWGVLLLLLPTFLILIQPSLGVTFLTTIGFMGVFLAAHYPRKYYLIAILLVFLAIPVGWNLMADYQKTRVLTFINPTQDPLGVGYNSLQSMISVGSGEIFGRGLGRGIGTQLSFLPERQTDFIFASISEELGFVGATLVILISFFLLYRLIRIFENCPNWTARAYVAGFFLATLAQILVHVGMNLGLLPITGVPYPLLSAGGSSLIATMIGLGIANSAKNASA